MSSVQAMKRESPRSPLWVLGASALLLAAGFGRKPATHHRRHPRADAPKGGQRAWPDSGERDRRRTASNGDRGRAASSPSEIPARGWKDILVRVYHGISEDRVLSIAAGVTFFALLALFPAIAALVSVYGLFADPGTIASQLEELSAFLPGGAIDIIGEQMRRL